MGTAGAECCRKGLIAGMAGSCAEAAREGAEGMGASAAAAGTFCRRMHEHIKGSLQSSVMPTQCSSHVVRSCSYGAIHVRDHRPDLYHLDLSISHGHYCASTCPQQAMLAQAERTWAAMARCTSTDSIGLSWDSPVAAAWTAPDLLLWVALQAAIGLAAVLHVAAAMHPTAKARQRFPAAQLMAAAASDVARQC